MSKEAVKQSKIKKKRWYSIVSPESLGERQIGESYLEIPQSAVNRTVSVNLMLITGDVKSQTSNVKFLVDSVKDNKLATRFAGYSFSPSSIRRLIRRRVTKIDDSIVILTKEGIKLRIKPMLLTRNKVSRAVEYTLRTKLREELINFVKKSSYNDIFNAVIKYQLQKELKDKLNKVYPVKNLEIRMLEEEKRNEIKETQIVLKKTPPKARSKKEENTEEEKVEEESAAEEAEAKPDNS